MEEKDQIIAELREKIIAQGKEIHQVAFYGNQLLQDKRELSAKIDDLQSEKELFKQQTHALHLDLETKTLALNSQTQELEIHRDKADDFREKLQVKEKENEALLRKVGDLRKEIQYLKKQQDELSTENEIIIEKNSLMAKQLKNFEDQAEKSLHEGDQDEIQEIQAQLNAFMLNNKELQDELSQIHVELEMAKKNERQLFQKIEELEETLSEKNSQISASNTEIKVAKEEIEELQAEIETLKFDQVDVKQRGNSVFAELDDRRHLVEREYKTLVQKFKDMQRNYEKNKEELIRARNLITSLQSLTTRSYQEKYINQLEEDLSSARMEVNELTLKLSKAIKTYAEKKDESVKEDYDYLREMLKQSQNREKEALYEAAALKIKIMNDEDKVIRMQKTLYATNKKLDATNLENIALKSKIKDLEPSVEPVNRSPKVDYLEGYKSSANNEDKEVIRECNTALLPVPDLIPGELELGEDGFKQVKPPRKSNRFMLFREFNTIKPDDKVNESCVKPASKKNTSALDSKDELKVSVEKEQVKPKILSHTKASSRRRNDDCAQQ